MPGDGLRSVLCTHRFSKTGYSSDWSFDELRSVLSKERSAKVYALGGLDINNFEEALGLGFDGVVLHGALWRTADPVEVLAQFRRIGGMKLPRFNV